MAKLKNVHSLKKQVEEIYNKAQEDGDHAGERYCGIDEIRSKHKGSFSPQKMIENFPQAASKTGGRKTSDRKSMERYVSAIINGESEYSNVNHEVTENLEQKIGIISKTAGLVILHQKWSLCIVRYCIRCKKSQYVTFYDMI